MKCDELKVHKAYNRWIDEEMPTPNDDLICNEVYLKDEVDAAIAELKQELEEKDAFIKTLGEGQADLAREIERLKQKLEDAGVRERRLNNALDKERSETIKYMDELCNAKNEIERLTIDKRNNELRADVAEATVEKLKTENAELKAQLESEKASRDAESVDAGMRERRLCRALYKACANWADAVAFEETEGIGYDNSVAEKWRKMESMCLKKAEEYTDEETK